MKEQTTEIIYEQLQHKTEKQAENINKQQHATKITTQKTQQQRTHATKRTAT